MKIIYFRHTKVILLSCQNEKFNIVKRNHFARFRVQRPNDQHRKSFRPIVAIAVVVIFAVLQLLLPMGWPATFIRQKKNKKMKMEKRNTEHLVVNDAFFTSFLNGFRNA